ncbi:SusF/SusE family outer membrane protein [Pedobacter sp. HMF7647]|uniref:SusF/SusE family outer membrane protein n=1 Tax=Hufsiella arboris TaxID=2695275 RepID=A0A7K1YBX1_9SPHI|nr:SusE domain-containing protein [Hufsiella arboris]MXV52102.1 SusF/SusE family outer membrane protein [Hufsiella arboris]
MKKILLYTTAIFFLILHACKKDEQRAVISADVIAPVITSPADGSSIVITAPDTSKAVSVKWSSADYNVNTIIDYVVQIDSAGKNFSKPATLGGNSSDSLSTTLGALNNTLLNSLKFTPNKAGTVELRVGATLNKKDYVYSNVVKISVTPFKSTITALWVPGQYQNWSPGNAPKIYSVGDQLYEGYVYMNVGDYFKFTSSGDWDHTNFGDGGAGKLTTDGLAGGLKVNVPGYYKFNVDTKNLTWSYALINSFGLIGSATSGGWDNSTPMTYDPVKNTWTTTANLVSGALKFRANNGWDINYGPADSNAMNGFLIQTDGAITIPSDGNYTVTIDMSRSSDPYKYSYTVKKN